MSKKDPVKEYRAAKAEHMNDALSEMGFGGVSDKNVAKAKTKESGQKLDAVKDQYGIGKASKGPSTASRIGKAFRNFGARISALVSPKAAAPPQAIPTAPAPAVDRGQQSARSEPAAAPEPDMAFSRADMRAKAANMNSRAETLEKARARTEEHAIKAPDRSIGR